jgi:penicillin-binding protein 1A
VPAPHRPYNGRVQYDPPQTGASPRPRRANPGRPSFRQSGHPIRWLRWTWPVVAALLVGTVAGVGVAAAIHIPRVDTLAGFTPSVVTQFFDRTGHVFASFARERRVMLKEGEIPVVMQQALLASEDSNFFRHGGIDAFGIVRAAANDIRRGRIVQGASTVTMQLARMVFLSRERTWRRKVEEALMAVELEKSYSKQQILTLYLNLVNLGHGNYGVEAASRYYFGKPARELTLPEAATLAGIIPAPSRYSPYRQPAVVLSQRNRVLRRMLEERFVDQAQYERAVALPLLVAPQAPEQAVAPYFAEDIRKYLETTYGPSTLYEGGLRVQTTLDPQMQQAAERAVREGLLHLDHRRGWRGPIAMLDAADLESQRLPTWVQGKVAVGPWYQGVVLAADAATARVKIGDQLFTLGKDGIAWTGRSQTSQLLRRGAVAWFRLAVPEEKATKKEKGKEKGAAAPAAPRLMLEQEPQMEGAALVLESQSGAVRAMVGGWNFERNKFNRVTQARRQVGSAFKPFVYGAALETGWTPADTLLDAPTAFIGADGKLSYRPENYYKKHYGIVTLRRALEQSINVPAVKLLDLISGRRVVDFAHRCGIHTPLPTYPSIALGSADLVPLEVAAAYATIANRGTHVEPFMLEKVATPDGQVLERHFPAAHTSTDPAVAYVLAHMMEGVVDHGTAYAINDLPLDIAGKTGTTDDFSDAWFIGFTPRYTILTWTGYDVKRSLGNGMSGAVAALPMWRLIAEEGLKAGWLQKGETFQAPPPGVVFHDVEYYTGLLPGPGSSRTVHEAFVAGTEPAREYSAKWSTITALPWYQQRAFYIPKEGEKMPLKGSDSALPPPAGGPEETPGPPP